MQRGLTEAPCPDAFPSSSRGISIDFRARRPRKKSQRRFSRARGKVVLENFAGFVIARDVAFDGSHSFGAIHLLLDMKLRKMRAISLSVCLSLSPSF